MKSSYTLAVQRLNDALRRTSFGGRVMVTRGIAALGDDAVTAILHAVATFDHFDRNNDPYEEHDCAVLAVGEHRIVWKIDYYDTELQAASPDPSDPSVTTRVLTIMLASEY